MRKAVLVAVICFASNGVHAADEAVWLRCSIDRSSREAHDSKLTAQVADEHLFIDIRANDKKSSRRLVIRIWSDHFIGTEAYYSWSEGINADIVTADFGKHGWKATRRRTTSGGKVWYGQLSIDRSSGSYEEHVTIEQEGVVAQERLSVGRCQETHQWIDKRGLARE